MKPLYGLGIMSGTSLDGVDLCICKFWQEKSAWQYSILEAETIPYSSLWKDKLQNVENESALELVKTDVAYGHYLGEISNEFLQRHKITCDFIASHGHTIFHQPENGFTKQIGDGAEIYAKTNIPVVSDFRTVDVALGGQGAPFVPIGDQLLFNKYDYCLNLGGIANVSYLQDKKRIAFDICPINMALNYLVSERGLAYDEGGKIASEGKCNQELLEKLNQLDFYQKSAPKSLGKEWFSEYMRPLLDHCGISLEDKLATICIHVAIQIKNCLPILSNKNLLVTGGGAFNSFFIEILKKQISEIEIIIPSKTVINYKEALIFGFLGVLRLHNQPNVLSEVTGAKKNSIGGTLYGDFSLISTKK
ncbi:MAG: anhydro-N-acetylmuramic acid kinase [Cytophagales bacterium]|nr:anhydro-N-acetylmuramic acid kinase [Cytophagales bacterium]